jgi:hypothetical protein
MRTIMYRDTYGSMGTFDETAQGDGTIYIEWNYGVDKNGKSLTSVQGYDKTYLANIMDIPKELYQEFVGLPAWSEEQKSVVAKILGITKVDDSKKCRECAHWAADPDDEYCAHPEVIKLTSAGSNLDRARGNISRKPKNPEDDPVFGLCGPEGKLWEQRSESRRLKRP